MSYYSDWKCGGLTDDQYASACEMEDKKDKAALEKEEEMEYTRNYIREAIEKALNDIGLDLTDIEIEKNTVTITCEADFE